MPALSDREFDPPLRIPFAPGASPFRQKGHAYVGDFEYFESRIPGGPAAVLRHVTDDALRAFLSQRFVGSEWYDAYPCLTLHVVAARLAGLTFEEHRRRIGAFHAQAMNGVYRALLRVISNENVALWVPRITAVYWDFGKTDSRVAGPHDVEVMRRGTPRGLLQWLVYASVGFADATLRASGAPSARTTIGEVVREGEQAGQELCSVALRITW